MDSVKTQHILELVKASGVLRARELRANGVFGAELSRLVDRGLLKRIGRGLYELPDTAATEHHTLVEAAKRVPRGVICLLSALNFHQLTTQVPFEIWIAIENKAWVSRDKILPLRMVRFSGAAFTSGIESYMIEGTPVRIYEAAKTVADCFKFRNKIGTDLCLDALRSGLRQHAFTSDQLWHYARICRVQHVIRPYLEAFL